jgi:hypothetical protein
MAWAGTETSPGPFTFYAVVIQKENGAVPRRMSGCDSRQPHQFPLGRAPACVTESPKLSLLGAAPRRRANFQWGRGRQVMHLPCKQADVGALPTDSTISLRGERDSGEPHKLSLRGRDSHPRYQFGRCSGCRSVKPVSKTSVGSDDWSITSTSHHLLDP